VACEKCNVWQHSKCLGITTAGAEKEDFHFICKDCKQRIEDAKKPKISLKFRTGLSSSPTQPKGEERTSRKESFVGVEVPKKRGPGRPPGTTRPISRPPQSNGHAIPYANQPARFGGPPYFQQPILNGYNSYAGAQQSVGRPQQFLPHANGYGQATQASHHPIMLSPNGYIARPGSSSAQPGSFAPPSNSSAFVRPTSSHDQYTPKSNAVPYHYPHYSSQSPPSRPPSQSPTLYPPPYNSTSHVFSNPNHGRMPSPVLNRPTMSPTQGNRDVGLTAGVTQKSPSTSYVQPSTQHGTPGTYPSNGISIPYPQTTPVPISRSPNMNHMSGLSPTKHSPVIPLPTHIPAMSKTTLPPNGPEAFRLVSGTPIFPPAENLAPSPKELSKSPVPSPSKNASPIQVGEAEPKRVNMGASTTISQPQQAGQ
jgi:hypothetical protein